MATDFLADPGSHTLVVGIGAIGVFVATFLLEARFSAIHVVDPDIVERKNLKRQFCYSSSAVGQPKVDVFKTFALDTFGLAVTAHYCEVQNLAQRVLYDADFIFCSADTLAARRFCNKITLENIAHKRKKTVLLDVGSEGFLAHVRIVGLRPDAGCLECDLSLYSRVQTALCSKISIPSNFYQCISKSPSN